MTEILLPLRFDVAAWVERWERMQRGYLVQRPERFTTLVQLLRATQPRVTRVLDLGCGIGCTMLPILQHFPEAEVYGIDLDPALLALAKRRLRPFGSRVHLLEGDLRDAFPLRNTAGLFEAIISSTALHWLKGMQVRLVYQAAARRLHDGGIFLNADHAPNAHPGITHYWDEQREEKLHQEGFGDAESWTDYYAAYAQALGVDLVSRWQARFGGWCGEELSLAWHLDALRSCGFSAVDCYWRCANDAILGGIR
jgi:SAM-dependent methyltransferase